jgi:hypothetical protein
VIAANLLPIVVDARAAANCTYVIEHAGKRVASVKTGTVPQRGAPACQV